MKAKEKKKTILPHIKENDNNTQTRTEIHWNKRSIRAKKEMQTREYSDSHSLWCFLCITLFASHPPLAARLCVFYERRKAFSSFEERRKEKKLKVHEVHVHASSIYMHTSTSNTVLFFFLYFFHSLKMKKDQVNPEYKAKSQKLEKKRKRKPRTQNTVPSRT